MVLKAFKSGQIQAQGYPQDINEVLNRMAENINSGSAIGFGIGRKLINGEKFKIGASIDERSHASVGAFQAPNGSKVNILNINPNDGPNLAAGQGDAKRVIDHELAHNLGFRHGQAQERLISQSLALTGDTRA
jgi:hypothetical protein